jgi:hypothetical protein
MLCSWMFNKTKHSNIMQNALKTEQINEVILDSIGETTINVESAPDP